MKVIVTALAAAALAATALLAPTATAAPAPAAEPTARMVVKKTFSFYAKFTSRQVAPYGNAKAERFPRTLKVEAVYRMAFESHADVADHLPRFIEDVYDMRRLYSAPGYLSPVQFEDQRGRATVSLAA